MLRTHSPLSNSVNYSFKAVNAAQCFWNAVGGWVSVWRHLLCWLRSHTHFCPHGAIQIIPLGCCGVISLCIRVCVCVCVCVRVCVCVGVYSGGHHIIFFYCKLISSWELCCRCHLGNRNSLFAFNTEIIFAVTGPLISGISQPHERGVSGLNPKTLLKQHDLAPTPHCLSWGPRSSRFTGWLSRMVVWTEKAEKGSVVLEESQRIFPLASLYWSESLIISFYVFSSYS